MHARRALGSIPSIRRRSRLGWHNLYTGRYAEVREASTARWRRILRGTRRLLGLLAEVMGDYELAGPSAARRSTARPTIPRRWPRSAAAARSAGGQEARAVLASSTR